MNGATEATLAELLAVAKTMNVNVEKLQSLMGGSGGVSSGMGNLAQNTNKASSALGGLANSASNLVSGALNIMGNILGKVVGGFTDTVKNLYNFGKAAAMGTAKLSDFYNAFKDLPFFIGNVAGLFADIIRYSEDLLEVYRNLTQVGASFGGDLMAMRQAAARSGLSMEEFSSIVSSNSQLFATMGANVQAGINKFTEASARLMGPGSPYARSILELGVTARDAAGYLTTVIAGQGQMGKTGALSADQLAKATQSYILELDALSKITGMRKDQIDAEVKKTEADQVWQVFLDSLNPQEQKNVQAALKVAAAGGAASLENFKNQIRGIDAPTSKLTENLAITTGGLSMLSGEQVRALKNAKNENAATEGMIAIQGRQAVAVKGYADKMGTALQTIAGDMLDQNMLRIGRSVITAGGDYVKAYNAAKKQAEDQAKGPAGALAKAQQDIKNFGNAIVNAVTTVIAPFTGHLANFAGAINETITTFMGSAGFKNAITAVAAWFDETFKLLKGKSFSEALEVLKSQASKAFEGIWGILGPIWEKTIKPELTSMFNTIVSFLEPYLKKAMDAMFNSISDFIYEKTGLGEKSTDRIQRQATEETAYYQSWLEDQKKKLGGRGAQQLTLTGWQDMDKQTLFELFKKDYESKGGAGGGRGIFNPTPVTRATGSLGMTGSLFENFGKGTPAMLHGTEAVVTPEQMSGIINNSLVGEVQMLNRLTAEVLRYAKETADHARRNVDATQGLSGNVFPTV